MFELCTKGVFIGALLSTGVLCAEGILSETFKDAGEGITVLAVDKSSSADLIVLKGGLREGLKAGVVCRVKNPDGTSAKIMVAESALTKSVALAIDGANIVPGSTVKFDITK